MDKMAVFMATMGNGFARAEQRPDGAWIVDHFLEDRYVHCIAKDPVNSSILYAGIHNQGVWCSTDAGRTWQPAGLEGLVIKSISVSPHDNSVLYAGSQPCHLYRSLDGAQTWKELAGFLQVPGRWWWFSPAEPPFIACVQAIGISPSEPDTLVVGIEFGAVVRSTDGGATWQGHRRGALRDCHSLTFHHTDGNWVYEAGGTGVGAACSMDGGATWRQPKAGLDRHYGWACAADPLRPDVWYASLSASFTWAQPGVPAAHVDGHANAGIYRSTGGSPWELLGGGLPEPLDHMAYTLLTDPMASGSIWAGFSNGEIWHSPDFGESWAMLPFSLGRIQRSLIMV